MTHPPQDARTLAQAARKEFEEGKRWDAKECSASEKEAADYAAAVQEKLNVLGANEAKAKAIKVTCARCYVITCVGLKSVVICEFGEGTVGEESGL